MARGNISYFNQTLWNCTYVLQLNYISITIYQNGRGHLQNSLDTARGTEVVNFSNMSYGNSILSTEKVIYMEIIFLHSIATQRKVF